MGDESSNMWSDHRCPRDDVSDCTDPIKVRALSVKTPTVSAPGLTEGGVVGRILTRSENDNVCAVVRERGHGLVDIRSSDSDSTGDAN